MNLEVSQAYSEVNRFLELIGEKYSSQVPKGIREVIKVKMCKEYEPEINPDIPIKEQSLKSKTLAIIAFFNLEYWCKDEEEKARLTKIYKDNELKYQEELAEKYNVDDLFANRRNRTTTVENEIIENNEEMGLVEIKQNSLYRRIIEKIKIIFNIR